MPVPLMCIVSQSHTVGHVCERLSLGFLLSWLLRKAIFTRQGKFFIQFTPKSIFFLFCFGFFCVFFFSFVAFYLYLILLFAEVTGSNPVEALIFFFRLLLSNCLNWKIYCDDHFSLSFNLLFVKINRSMNKFKKINK